MNDSFTKFLANERNEIALAIGDWDVDFEYDKIIQWCIANKKLIIWWETELNRQHWRFQWQYGAIGFDALKENEREKAHKAAALFVYLWSKGVSAGIAERCAASYAVLYNVQ